MGLRVNTQPVASYLPEYETLKQKAKQEGQSAIQEAQDALKRRFAAMGNLQSGEFIKQQQLAQTEGQKQLGSTLSQIDVAQAQEQQRRAELETGRQFASTEAEKQRQFTKEQTGQQQDFSKELLGYDNTTGTTFEQRMAQKEYQENIFNNWLSNQLNIIEKGLQNDPAALAAARGSIEGLRKTHNLILSNDGMSFATPEQTDYQEFKDIESRLFGASSKGMAGYQISGSTPEQQAMMVRYNELQQKYGWAV